jgi:hypothetical protein
MKENIISVTYLENVRAAKTQGTSVKMFSVLQRQILCLKISVMFKIQVQQNSLSLLWWDRCTLKPLSQNILSFFAATL